MNRPLGLAVIFLAMLSAGCRSMFYEPEDPAVAKKCTPVRSLLAKNYQIGGKANALVVGVGGSFVRRGPELTAEQSTRIVEFDRVCRAWVAGAVSSKEWADYLRKSVAASISEAEKNGDKVEASETLEKIKQYLEQSPADKAAFIDSVSQEVGRLRASSKEEITQELKRVYLELHPKVRSDDARADTMHADTVARVDSVADQVSDLSVQLAASRKDLRKINEALRESRILERPYGLDGKDQGEGDEDLSKAPDTTLGDSSDTKSLACKKSGNGMHSMGDTQSPDLSEDNPPVKNRQEANQGKANKPSIPVRNGRMTDGSKDRKARSPSEAGTGLAALCVFIAQDGGRLSYESDKLLQAAASVWSDQRSAVLIQRFGDRRIAAKSEPVLAQSRVNDLSRFLEERGVKVIKVVERDYVQSVGALFQSKRPIACIEVYTPPASLAQRSVAPSK